MTGIYLKPFAPAEQRMGRWMGKTVCSTTFGTYAGIYSWWTSIFAAKILNAMPTRRT